MKWRPVHLTHCADCGVGTGTLGEYYMVKDDVWKQAWAGYRKSYPVPGQEILCIGCLERRIGRMLMKCDFTDVPVNDLKHGPWHRSVRLIDRLMREGRSISAA